MTLSGAPDLRLITIADVEALHAELYAWYFNKRDLWMSPWESKVADGWSSILGSVGNMVQYGKYTTVAQTAAAIMCHGVTTQYLTEGNKRLASYSMNAQLLWNGYELAVTDSNMYTFVMLVANTRPENIEAVVDVVSRWLEQTIEPCVDC